MNWEKLSTPPIIVCDALANLQTEFYMGYMSENVFIGYVNVIFDAAMMEEE